jgi:ketosteroid isomerase-like protein
MPTFTAWGVLLLLLCSSWVAAAENPAHEELRVLRTEIIDAITRGDIDAVIQHVHPDVVVTWQNSEVCRGHAGLLEFFHRMGKNSFRGYKLPPTPDELTVLHGDDTGISFGETAAEYNLLGRKYEIRSRWTATLVKQDGRWLLAGYHISMNALDNPLLNSAKNGVYLAGAVSLLFGVLIGRKLAKRKV